MITLLSADRCINITRYGLKRIKYLDLFIGSNYFGWETFIINLFSNIVTHTQGSHTAKAAAKGHLTDFKPKNNKKVIVSSRKNH